MDVTSINSSRVVTAISAVILVWIFWPIISSIHIILGTIVYLPVGVTVFLLGTVGETILFVVSLCSFIWLTRDAFVKNGTESNESHDMPSEEEAGAAEVGHESNLESEKILSSEMPSEEIGEEINEDKYIPVVATDEDGHEEYREKEANISNEYQTEEKLDYMSDGTTAPAVHTENPADLALAKSLATQILCEDILGADLQDQNEMPVAPSAC